VTDLATEPFVFDPFDRDVISDPLPYYEILRRDHPAYYLPRYDAWVISRFEDVFEVLADNEGNFVAVEGTVVGQELLEHHNPPGHVPPAPLDPLDKFSRLPNPVYGDIRHAFGAPLRPRATQRIEPFVREQAREAAERAREAGTINLVADYGGYVAARTMCLLFGIDLDEWRDLLDVVNAYTEKDPDTGAFRPERKSSLDAFSYETVARRRAAGADGSLPTVDGLINFEYQGRRLTDEEIVQQLNIVLIGGSETVPKVVAHGLLELQRHPDQRAAIGTDPDRIAKAFDEILRYCAPAQWFLRTVAKPVTVAGRRLEPGQRVIPLNMSANRDEREFPDPDEFRWDREIRRHVAFGQGMKFCVGAHVARLEGKVLIQEFLRAFPGYRIDETALYRPPSSFQWGYMRMPATVAG